MFHIITPSFQLQPSLRPFNLRDFLSQQPLVSHIRHIVPLPTTKHMGFPLVLGTLLLTYIPSIVLINYTILPYVFVTATFLKAIFYHICSFTTVAIFWLAFQTIPSQYAYLMILILYCVLSYTIRLYILDDAQYEYNSFSIVGSNNALHPTHPVHRGWGIGVGWGLSEATIFFGLPILTQFGAIRENATLFPSPITPCGTFSHSFTPLPILFPTAIMWLCVFLSTSLLTLASAITKTYSKHICVTFFFHFINLILHYSLYAVTWGVRSSGWCLAPIVTPLSFLLFIGLYVWVLTGMFVKSDPTVRKILSTASLTAERLRELRLSRRNRHNVEDEIDSNTFDRGEPTRGNYVEFQDDDENTQGNNINDDVYSNDLLSDGTRQRQRQGNSATGDELLFQDYGRNDQNDVYDQTIQ